MNYKSFLLKERLNMIESTDYDLLFDCLKTIQKSYQEKSDFEVSKSGGYTIIGFRGTKSVHDWFLDLEFSSKELVHRGFKKRSDEIDISKIVEENSNLIFTGHSLGAAVAAFKFLETKIEARPKAKMLICFGSPHLGKEEFYNSLLLRFVSNPQKEIHYITLVDKERRDPVTTLPSSLAEIDPKLVDFVDLHSGKEVSRISKILGKNLHDLSSYKTSLDDYISILRKKEKML